MCKDNKKNTSLPKTKPIRLYALDGRPIIFYTHNYYFIKLSFQLVAIFIINVNLTFL